MRSAAGSEIRPCSLATSGTNRSGRGVDVASPRRRAVGPSEHTPTEAFEKTTRHPIQIIMADGVAQWSVEDVANWLSSQRIDGADAVAQRFREEEINGEALLAYASGGRTELKEHFGVSIGKATALLKEIRELAGAAEPSSHTLVPRRLRRVQRFGGRPTRDGKIARPGISRQFTPVRAREHEVPGYSLSRWELATARVGIDEAAHAESASHRSRRH